MPAKWSVASVPQATRQPDVVNFDAYELRLSTREFLKHGLRIKLPPQAFHVLQMLVERAGQLISRHEFHRALWPADTYSSRFVGTTLAKRELECNRPVAVEKLLPMKFAKIKLRQDALQTTILIF
jgi:hypothetical protein